MNDEFLKLAEADREKCLDWVYAYCVPAMHYNTLRTSYGLKHLLESCTGVYMTNDQFKDMMLKQGFYPQKEKEENWVFKVKEEPLKLAERYIRCKEANRVLY